MTTFQDPPLQSRRAVRQNERDQSQPAVVAASAGPTPAGSRRAADLLRRRAALRFPTTTARLPRPPHPGAASNEADRGCRRPAPRIPASAPRDFSPEGRRAASPELGAPVRRRSPDGNVEYQTQQRGAAAGARRPELAVRAARARRAHRHPVGPRLRGARCEHTLTRRELRALRDAHGITSTTTGETEYPTPEPRPRRAPAPRGSGCRRLAAAGTPLAAPSTRLDSALAEFDQLAAGRPAPVPTDPPAPRGRRAAAAAAAAPLPPGGCRSGRGPVAPVAAAPVAARARRPGSRAPAPAPAPAARRARADRARGAGRTDAVVADAAPAGRARGRRRPSWSPSPSARRRRPQPAEAGRRGDRSSRSSSRRPSTPPTGHWSTQAQLDDETQFATPRSSSQHRQHERRDHDERPGAARRSRTTTSDRSRAARSWSPARSPCPRASPRPARTPTQLDESDLDHLLDPGDHQVASTDSQPVRAIKAVSTHTSSRGVIQTVQAQGQRRGSPP